MISIDMDRCITCGTCGTVCPRHIPETIEDKEKKLTRISRSREGLCMLCGHCMAVCPNDAIRIEGLNSDTFIPLQPLEISSDDLLTLMAQRRSIRRYKDKPIPRETLDRIIAASCRAPTGSGRSRTGVIVIDKPKALEVLSNHAHEMYRGLDKILGNPIGRLIIKRRVGNRLFHTLRDFVMPGMRWYLQWKKEGRGDEILRDCKALMLFHSPILEPMGDTNCAIAAFHAIFMAQALGVGTCFNDLIPPVCNRSRELRNYLGLPEDREVYSSLTMGFPRFKFQKMPPRRCADIRYIDDPQTSP
jgi:nitroreductase/NAD-dependent dihydropyrimidine dehydrogenase PreA subunit